MLASLPCPSNSVKSTTDMFDDDNYTRGWKEAALAVEMTASPHHNNNHLTDAAMRTFKPPNYDDVACSSSRSRPLAMRRERSDLGPSLASNGGINFGIVGKSNAQRLAFHNESSPGPAHTQFGRVPMTPPANAEVDFSLKSIWRRRTYKWKPIRKRQNFSASIRILDFFAINVCHSE
ncbi:unnamed protein product [Caenorhabditis sp. 36 PRJEB53466]|nr:unnamed protein product [Caenorhabditis sp. 36 PRJEB53466]